MSKNKNILFFSNYCSHSKKCLEIINKTNLRQQILLFCIDENMEKIPSFIKSVPTILTPNKDLLQGKQLFNYLENIYNSNQESNFQPSLNNSDFNTNTQINQSISLNNNQNNNVKEIEGDPLAWHGTEMGAGFSDNYSFIDIDTSAEGQGGQSIAHNFEFLGGNNLGYGNFNSNIKTPEELSKNEKKDPLMEKMEQLKNSRDNDVPRGISRI